MHFKDYLNAVKSVVRFSVAINSYLYWFLSKPKKKKKVSSYFVIKKQRYTESQLDFTVVCVIKTLCR